MRLHRGPYFFTPKINIPNQENLSEVLVHKKKTQLKNNKLIHELDTGQYTEDTQNFVN